jgi:hypothetical protein
VPARSFNTINIENTDAAITEPKSHLETFCIAGLKTREKASNPIEPQAIIGKNEDLLPNKISASINSTRICDLEIVEIEASRMRIAKTKINEKL